MKMSIDPEVEHLLDLFQFAHLPQHLQRASAPFARLADKMASRYEPGWELKAGLRKLLEAKDCMVRQAKEDEDAQQAGYNEMRDAQDEAQDEYDKSVGAKPYTDLEIDRQKKEDAGRVTVGHGDCFPSHLGGCQHSDADCPRQAEYLADKERLREIEREKLFARAQVIDHSYGEYKEAHGDADWRAGLKVGDRRTILGIDCIVEEVGPGGRLVGRALTDSEKAAYDEGKWLPTTAEVRNLVATPKISPEMLLEQLRAVGSPHNSIVRTGEPGEMPWLNKAVISGEFNLIELAEILNDVVAKQVRSKEAP